MSLESSVAEAGTGVDVGFVVADGMILVVAGNGELDIGEGCCVDGMARMIGTPNVVVS